MSVRLLLLLAASAFSAAPVCVAVPLTRDLSLWEIQCLQEPGVIRHVTPVSAQQWEAAKTPPDTVKAK